MKRYVVKYIAAVFVIALLCTPQSVLRAQGTVDSVAHARALDSLLQWKVSDTLMTVRPIGFQEFLAAVAEHNVAYAAQKYNVSIANAQITVAQLYPDPALSVDYTKDVSNVAPEEKFGDAWTFGLSETFPLGGKIGARSGVASALDSATRSQVEDFFRNLRATATQSYIAAVVADSIYRADERMYENLASLTRFNETRLAAGDMGKVDVIQSRVDAIQARGAVLQADAARRQAFIALAQLMGRLHADTLFRPDARLNVSQHSFDLDSLIARAKESRPDVIAARRSLEAARLGIDLAHAERWPDLNVGASYGVIGHSTNSVAPFPGEFTLGLNVAVPLPLSDIVNKGTLQVAEITYEQAKKTLESAELQAESDVRQAYAQYQLAEQQYSQYSTELLGDAEQVERARLYSYKAGSTSLVDVLTAETTLVNIYLADYGALSSYANALVALEQAAGIWDIAF